MLIARKLKTRQTVRIGGRMVRHSKQRVFWVVLDDAETLGYQDTG